MQSNAHRRQRKEEAAQKIMCVQCAFQHFSMQLAVLVVHIQAKQNTFFIFEGHFNAIFALMPIILRYLFYVRKLLHAFDCLTHVLLF